MSGGERESEERNEASPGAGEVINSRYRVVRRLGQGGMGSVWLAVDPLCGNREVALKRVRSDRVDPKTLSTIRNEFLALAALRHPNVARVWDFGLESASRDIFFTSELVAGPGWLKATRDLDLESDEGFETFLGTVAGVLRGLEFIHGHGLVHLDLKPDNVLVEPARQGAGASPVPKLIDFGLAKREKEFGGKRIMGTTHYIAPETILGARVDRRTDLYSLGVVLYQLASGKLPFRGKNNLDVFKGHLERAPRPPHEVRPSLPRRLSTIILCLIEKKPADRFQTALEVLDEINRELGFSFPLETESTTFGYLEAARPVGREEELEKLRVLFSQATKTEPLGVDAEAEVAAVQPRTLLGDGDVVVPALPDGRMLLLRGEKGIGKRRLVEQLRHLAQTQGATVLEVECGAAEGSSGEDLFNWIREVVAYATTVQAAGGAGDFGAAAVELARYVKESGAEDLDEAGRRRLEDVCRGLAAATRTQPALLHLHDLHLADRALLRAVDRLVDCLASEDALGARLLVTASTLDLVDTEATPLQWLYGSDVFRRSVLELRLERLDGEAVARMVRTAFAGSEVPEDFCRRVHEESDGNPEIVLDILGFFLRRGTICRTPLGWTFPGEYLHEPVPGKVRLELKARIGALTEPALRLARAFAYLGDAAELELAARLAGLDTREAEECVGVLRSEKLLQERFEGDAARVLAFVHSSARDVLYQLVPEDQRPAEHERAGQVSEAFYAERGRREVRSLAHHFLRAGHREKGLEYGVEAARSYRDDFRPLEAIEIYERALALVPGAGDATATELRIELAGARHEVGDYAGVLEAVEPLLDDAGEPVEIEVRCRAALVAAQAAGRLGRYDFAAELTRRVVDGLQGRRHPEILGQLLLACADIHAGKGNLVESLRCCERLAARRDELEATGLLSRLHLRLAENHYRLDDRERAARDCQEALRLVDEQAETPSPDLNLLCLAKYYKYRGQLLKAARQFELAAQVSRRLGASDRRAVALFEVGSIHLWLERPQAALPALQQAETLFRRCRDRPLSVEARCALGETHRHLGEYEEARRCLGEAFKGAESLGNTRAKTGALLSYAGLCVDAGDLEGADRYVAEAEGTGLRLSGRHLLAFLDLRFRAALHRGELGEALDHAAKGLVAGGQGEDRVATAPLIARKAMLQVRLGKRMEARRAQVTLLELAKTYSFPLCEGRARMLEGAVLASEGKAAAAERSFDRAVEIFRSEGCERELLHVYLERGLLALVAGRYEDTYLDLEEGFYLAKKLGLNYMKCRYYLAMGLLELLIPEGQEARAEERFRFAEQLALRVPYAELLWQIRYWLGKLYARAGREEEAETCLAQALAGRRETTERIPLTFRHGYLKASTDEAIEERIEARSEAVPG